MSEKNEELIERMKNNWTALGGLSEEEREFLHKHKEHVGMIGGRGTLHNVANCKFDSNNVVYRLSPDFSLPKPRWFFHLTTHKIASFSNPSPLSVNLDEQIEVREENLPYLEKPEGDWEFRVPEYKDDFVSIELDKVDSKGPILNHREAGSYLSHYRWCKVSKEAPVSEICPDAEHLEWIRQRMIHVHGENPQVDYMAKFEEIIKARFYVGK